MKRGKGFFDGEFSVAEGKTPVEPRTIKGVKFVDSPREEEAPLRDAPYIPSEQEWDEIKAEFRRHSFSIGLSIVLSAIVFIFAICALVTK